MRDRIVNQCPSVGDKIHVIHNWADHTRIQPKTKDQNWFAQDHGFDQIFTVLYSGNMGRCHDIETLHETICLLRDQPIRFLFIGGGAKREILEKQVKEAGLTNICFLPYQEWENLPYTLTACDLSLVTISKGMEGLVVPSKLYSSLAIGRPVAAICESHSYLVNILSDANCGQTFINGDAQGLANYILTLSHNPEWAQTLGCNARTYLEHHFTRDIIAAQYKEVLLNAM